MSSRPLIYPPLIMLLFAGLMWFLDSTMPVLELFGATWQRWGYALMASAIALDLWALGLFHRSGTTMHPLRLADNSSLVTHGAYGLTRNPMYLGLLLLLTGLAVRLGTLSPFVMLPLFVWVLNRVQIVHEERFLANRYPARYRAYCDKVPRWI